MRNINIISLNQKINKEIPMELRFSIIDSPNKLFNVLKEEYGDMDRECFIVVGLDTKKFITFINVAHIGSLNSTIVHPREIFKPAILANSDSIILAHNHPSGITIPSEEDILMTKRIIKSGTILGIEVIDHLIFSNESYRSILTSAKFIDG